MTKTHTCVLALLLGACSSDPAATPAPTPVEAPPTPPPAKVAAPSPAPAVPVGTPSTPPPDAAVPPPPEVPTTVTPVDLGTFEASGDSLPLAGFTEAAPGHPAYEPLGLEWTAVAALLEATPGLRWQRIGFYAQRPVELPGTPELFRAGRVFPLSRPGHWRPAPGLQLVVVPYHHVVPNLAIYAPAGAGHLRFVTKFDPGECDQDDYGAGFVVTPQAEQVRGFQRCGPIADVITFEARDGKLAGTKVRVPF